MNRTSPMVITISRQLGAGGVYVGQQLAMKLDLFYADREIIRRAAKELSVMEETLETREEKVRSFWRSFFHPFTVGLAEAYVPAKVNIPTSRELFDVEAKIIRRIAQDSPAVIIGRCASHILRDHPHRVSIFLHADKAFRKNRIRDYYQVPDDTAENMIDRNDRERALYHRTFTGGEWSDAARYDMTLDTGKIGLDRSVELILNYIGFR